MSSHIYILALEHDCFYVGRSKNVKMRIQAHFQGEGSSWTQMHPVVNVVRIMPSQCNEEEDMWTKRLMRQHSIEQVRGGTYSRPTLSQEEIKFIEKEIRHNKDDCFKCGSPDHFIRDCPERGSFFQKPKIFLGRSSRQIFRNPARQVFKDQYRNLRNKKLIDQELYGQSLWGNEEESQSYYDSKKFKKYWQVNQEFENYWDQLGYDFEEEVLKGRSDSASERDEEGEEGEEGEQIKVLQQREEVLSHSSGFIADGDDDASESNVQDFIDDRQQLSLQDDQLPSEVRGGFVYEIFSMEPQNREGNSYDELQADEVILIEESIDSNEYDSRRNEDSDSAPLMRLRRRGEAQEDADGDRSPVKHKQIRKNSKIQESPSKIVHLKKIKQIARDSSNSPVNREYLIEPANSRFPQVIYSKYSQNQQSESICPFPKRKHH